MNSGTFGLAHQFVVDFTENFAVAVECGFFSLSTHLKSLIICKLSDFLRTQLTYSTTAVVIAIAILFPHQKFPAQNTQCSLAGCSFISINSKTDGSVLLNGAVTSKDHYKSANGMYTNEPEHSIDQMLTVVNGTSRITRPSAALSSTGSACLMAWPYTSIF
jgi:hypothetical protein